MECVTLGSTKKYRRGACRRIFCKDQKANVAYTPVVCETLTVAQDSDDLRMGVSFAITGSNGSIPHVESKSMG